MVADTRLVMVTGAGASRSLGRGEEMPLMKDWGLTLQRELNAAEQHLANACGLRHVENGEQFETALGELLTWGRSLDLQRKFASMASKTPAQAEAGFGTSLQRAERRWPVVREVINRTLFREFGLRRIDHRAAADAYADLFAAL